MADLFKDDTEAFLVKVISERGIANFPADNTLYDTIIGLDQFSLSLPVAGPNAADEIGSYVNLTYSFSVYSLNDRSPLAIKIGPLARLNEVSPKVRMPQLRILQHLKLCLSQ
jgi:hypothetical protein